MTEQKIQVSESTMIQAENNRKSLSTEAIKHDFLDKLLYVQGKSLSLATKNDFYMALAYTIRDRVLNHWISSNAHKERTRTVCYLSAEFLMGPHLGNNLINLGIYDLVKQVIEELGLKFEELLELEEEPGLGNGGLGRLAACYLDSLATLEVPALGYGIRYEFGIFDQEIRDGWQVEITDKWLRYGNPWEIRRPEWEAHVKFGGYTEHFTDSEGRFQVRWIPYQVVNGVPFDTPILGYKVNTANTLRLWRAEAPESFDFSAFNRGDYYGAVDQKVSCENITKVLYPNDESLTGKQLRLEQQYFFVSCSLQDMIRILKQRNLPIESFHEEFTVQLNDTHPAIAVAELMRLLLDEHQLDWDTAWGITQKTFAYTNHTLLPEALEKWSLDLFGSLLPRLLEIIYEINHRFLTEIEFLYPDDHERIARLSIIDESGERYIRMANLACVGSHAINGVAQLHTVLLQETVLRDFYEIFPEKFSNKTNGVTPRRFMVLNNPGLSNLITSKIGADWIKNLEDLRQLEAFVDDSAFREQWFNVKRNNKVQLAERILQRTGVVVNPDSMFDVQVKRIHEYKRQHLNVLHIVTLYNRLKENPELEITPRTFIFGGKAAPGYFAAKLIIKLINSVAEVVNNDPDIRGQIKVVFLPDYNVTNSQLVYPTADLSEQISTAGKEASGTGNMKFALNGALTIGTLDGANIEIREQVGEENFFLFGLTNDEIQTLRWQGYYPGSYYETNHNLRKVIDLIASGHFANGDVGLFRPLIESLLYGDHYMLMADYQSYIDCQDKVSQAYLDTSNWTRMSILNTARAGKFSSDRAIREYCQDIWKVQPQPI
ncbi:MAG: glycogen/starch/alpha-glucan phosphorylase [Calothrix sp. C42_A2020_038]|nr:glycogen/starch/alpha-glucan phosphorylase [Calothrix sp. C42_A2020_038]